jgi:diaminopimelate epimerase
MFPERTNISLAVVRSPGHLVVRTWERGAGLTKACGSAACAAAVAAARTGRAQRKLTVTLPGGDLLIEWRLSDGHVLMTGPVEYEFEGQFEADLLAQQGVA